ncbi:uncharacterized protein SAPINGB_P003237 [Magnusiomyces paraingens]|uniref:Histone-lysine N-methyltransferase SET5 n=1 Tax=Magnusiomyces paraingens TaxID=2606893 RepID=A0A5E8BJW0_9ASCO|nr:uncharacterized protein SAPINGB_P003237 [Saprochaete ingens]VVT51860.1 unnamed protein product [Saprochaete ingens]
MATNESPHDRQIVLAAIDVWQQDKRFDNLSTDKLYRVILKNKPEWRPASLDDEAAFTPERLHKCLADANMTPDRFEPQSYASKIVSKFPVPYLVIPSSASSWIDVRPIVSSDPSASDSKYKGKGVFAKTEIPKDKTIWTETALFSVPSVSSVPHMRAGNACAHCGTVFARALGTVGCTQCEARFCGTKCRAAATSSMAHAATWHVGTKLSKTAQIGPKAWRKYEDMCSGAASKDKNNEAATESAWAAGYAVGMVLVRLAAEAQKSLEGALKLQEQFEAMATVGQDVRQAHAAGAGSNAASRSLFASEQEELVLKDGYNLLSKAITKAFSLDENTPGKLTYSYDRYLHNIGTWNLNNIKHCVFLIQSNLNHSCEPNSKTVFGNTTLDPISIVALRDISADEELTISYVDPSLDYPARQRQLKGNWGFQCECSRCVREKPSYEVDIDADGNIIEENA